MSLQSLPRELLIIIFGYSDSFRTATRLSATSRSFHSIWTLHAEPILQQIAHTVIPRPLEANILADRYEEIFTIRPSGDRVADAIRRAVVLWTELRIMQRGVEDVILALRLRRQETCGWNTLIPSMLLEDQPEILLKLAYRAISFAVSGTSYLYLNGPVSVPRKVFRGMRMRELKMLPFAVYTIMRPCQHRHKQKHDGETSQPPPPFNEFADHFGLFWSTWCGGGRGYRSTNFDCLSPFLISLTMFLTLLHFDLVYDDQSSTVDETPDLKMMDFHTKETEYSGKEVEDLLASASCCTIEEDCWIIDVRD